MRWNWGRTLLWTALGLATAAFVLASVGEETSAASTQEVLLQWHQALGLLSLIALIAAMVMRQLARHADRPLLPNWLPGLRHAVEYALYFLLVLQPISGWLLASHEGKLASFLGWTLPPLASPSSTLAEYGYVYHGLGGVLIMLVAIIDVRLNASAIVYSLVRRVRRRRQHRRSAAGTPGSP